MPTVQLSFENILLSVAVILLLANTISSLNKGKKDWRELSGAEQRSQEIAGMKDRIKSLEDTIAKVEVRLDKGDANFDKVSNDTEQIMNVLDGLLMHFISGNDKEKLRSVKDELDHYKNGRK